jgi:D-alanyl-D-alanine dipeptidase
VGGRLFTRRPFDGEDGTTFTITPLYSYEELHRRALRASPPREKGSFLRTELVELQSLDSTVRYDIRYASTNNFMKQQFYSLAKAYMQRPAADALIRAHEWLKLYGYGLLIHDAYRPWMVTKMFWDATPNSMKDFVANPASGSRHNRGCAVDVTLYDLASGQPIEMVSGYDEFSGRSHPDYPGGTSLQRWHRRLLREAFERNGFTVYRFEWWHFDYNGWERYRIVVKTFEDLK